MCVSNSNFIQYFSREVLLLLQMALPVRSQAASPQGGSLLTLLFIHFSHADSSATLWTIAHQAPLPMEFSRQEYWSGLPCPPAGDLPDSGIEPVNPALADGFFASEPQGKPLRLSFVQLLSRVQLFATPWTAAHQASLSFTIS